MTNIFKGIWNFIWKSNSIWSWIISFILAFLIVKYLIYPGLGLLLATSYPIVAVVSTSMEHYTDDQDKWWLTNGGWYEDHDIQLEEFKKFDFSNGFNKGDIMILVGKSPKNINIGDILVFQSNLDNSRNSNVPIIHRVVNKWEVDGKYHFQTKGDNNSGSGQGLDELDISEERVIGKAVFRVPYLGWLKIAFSKIV